MKRRLLFVHNQSESDDEISNLRNGGFEVKCAVGFTADDAKSHDLVVLDLGALDAADTVRTIRTSSDVPLVVLSDNNGAVECVVALELGADDYIRKPIAESELVARIKALLRRENAEATVEANATLTAGDIQLFSAARIVKRAGMRVDLTPVEFELLKILLGSVGTLVTREVISREVFQRASARNRAIDVHMSGLRKKLGTRKDGVDRIRTIRGYGYIYANGEP